MAARASGILLHPTCLPGRYGVGDLGPEALRFLDQLAAGRQTVWQMLPLGPTSSHHSPYDGPSAFAGNDLLISPQALVQDGLLARRDVDSVSGLALDRVDPVARELKSQWLRSAWTAFCSGRAPWLIQPLAAFVGAPEQRPWLDDWALFAALRQRFDNRPWFDWPSELRNREPRAIAAMRRDLGENDFDGGELGFHRFAQFLFFRQWQALRERARRLGIRLCGDVPIYVAHDSADVWVHRELFDLDSQGHARSVAGVPPDAFSDDGQRWGNPTYFWPAHRQNGYRWWRQRLNVNLSRFDLLRIDHFRGFVAFWKVPADEPTARQGHWVRGPGHALFRALAKLDADGEDRPRLPLIAEDLGHITAPVRALRRELGLPGMRVLQFGFDDADSEHRPDRIPSDAVVYTGTHDNDTTLGWVQSLSPEMRSRATGFLGLAADAPAIDIVRRLARAAFDSRAELAILPLQDVLGLGRDARMNRPGTVDGNWLWRAPQSLLDQEAIAWLRELSEETGRNPGAP